MSSIRVKKIIFRFSLLGLLLLGGIQHNQAIAQCPMCKMSAESNMKNGGKAGNGLNAGILYMFSLPYLIVAGMGVWWYRNRKKEESERLAEEVIKDVSRLN